MAMQLHLPNDYSVHNALEISLYFESFFTLENFKKKTQGTFLLY